MILRYLPESPRKQQDVTRMCASTAVTAVSLLQAGAGTLQSQSNFRQLWLPPSCALKRGKVRQNQRICLLYALPVCSTLVSQLQCLGTVLMEKSLPFSMLHFPPVPRRARLTPGEQKAITDLMSRRCSPLCEKLSEQDLNVQGGIKKKQ